MVQPKGRNRHYGKAIVADDERILIRAVSRSAILYDPESPGRKLMIDTMVEENDTIGDIFLETITRQRVLTTFSGDDRGDPAILDPPKKASKLGAKYPFIRKPGKQGFEGVKH